MPAQPPLVLPLDFETWMPAAQALTLGLLTLAQEDVPAIGAALLAAGGTVTWPAAWLGVFLGIWLGDALLYGLARGVGRPLLSRPWARRFCDPSRIARSERWVAQRGVWLLLSSRFVPGTRLPSYLAAGFLRLPFGRFLAVTGLAVAIWTGGIFLMARAFGPSLVEWLQRWSSLGLALMLLTIAGVLAVWLLGRVGDAALRRRIAAALVRWTRWEFWPAWLFYLPVALYYLWLSVRHWGLTLPTAANPGMESGGLVGESKLATLRELQATSPEFTAQAFSLPAAPCPTQRKAWLDQLRRAHDLKFPFVLKPDVGQRGAGVKLIRSETQAGECLRRTSAALIVQRYAPGPNEAGIFYFRFPHESRGRIFAITEKIFPAVIGDGTSTIEELIWRDERARLVAATYLKRLGPRRLEVPQAGEAVRLVEAGNHAQGCVFRDGARLWSVDLERRIDSISRRLSGFCVGRYDVRYESETDLRAGRNFAIIELNGAAAEATNIYDARNSLAQAYRTLFRQWELVFAIGAANRRRGAALMPLFELARTWRETAALVATHPAAD